MPEKHINLDWVQENKYGLGGRLLYVVSVAFFQGYKIEVDWFYLDGQVYWYVIAPEGSPHFENSKGGQFINQSQPSGLRQGQELATAGLNEWLAQAQTQESSE